MDIFDVLKNERSVFVLDDIEDKKTKTLISQINGQLSTILDKMDKFDEFASSQLEGDYHNKIIMAKSLKKVYSNWITVSNACQNLANEEASAINAFNSEKIQLINNLQILLKDSQKLPVICDYDVFNDQYMLSKKNHSIIILGGHNVAIIETLIKDINEQLIVEGNFNNVDDKELNVNYASVEKNVEECKREVSNRFGSKPSKEEKILSIIEAMEVAGKNLVFFATYKEDIKKIGCNLKEVDLYEKDLFKKYVPLKKQLSKLLKVEFVDVCDLSHDEADFPTQEFKAISDEDIDDLFKD